MKSRTQLYLDGRQKKALEERSAATGKSMGQLVREAVEEVYLKSRRHEKPISRNDPFWDYVGAGKSKNTDVSIRHDYYLYGSEE